MMEGNQGDEQRRPDLPQDLEAHLQSYALLHKTEIHNSLYLELSDYVRHDGVCDLTDVQRRTVVQRIGRLAIDLPGKTADAGGVRSVIFSLCPEGHSTCFAASRTILESDPARLRQMLATAASRKRQLLERIELVDLEPPEITDV